jgi:ATP-dependent DNA ligase
VSVREEDGIWRSRDSQNCCPCLCCPACAAPLNLAFLTKFPTGPDWLHEVKYDGYRLRMECDGERVRLITRGGYNWTSRYPWIVEAALKNRLKPFVIDGEAAVLGLDGIATFDALHSRRHDDEVLAKPACANMVSMPSTSRRSTVTNQRRAAVIDG